MSEITVRVTQNFGNQMVYPVCPVAVKLAELAGTKTFTDKTVNLIRDLGFTIKVQTPNI